MLSITIERIISYIYKMKITTKRLIIQNPKPEYAIKSWEYRTNPHAAEFTGGVLNLNFEEYKEKYIKMCNEFESSNNHVFAVTLKETGDYIGYCGIQYCENLKDNEILYGLLQQYWGKGYGKEAAKAVIEYALNELGYKRIAAAVNPENPGSEKILKTIGMELDGQIQWPNQGMVNKYIIHSLR